MASVESLPNEISAAIAHQCSFDALAQLSLTCKRLNAIAQPCLWSDIELHEQGFHESSAELKAPAPFKLPSQRAYHNGGEREWPQDTRIKAEKLFKMFQALHRHDETKLEELASRVKNLCTVVDPTWRPDADEADNPIPVWYLLPYFTNLETLELHGDWHITEETGSDIEGPPLAKLRFAKLHAYLPRAVGTYVLRSGAILERLELGMLDRPISTNLAYNSHFRPEENLGKDGDSDYGSLSGDAVIPRPQGDFFPSSPVSLPNLRHLYLCKASKSGQLHTAYDYTLSSRAERAALETWREILLTSSPTLETLVLDHRPGAEYIENDTYTEAEYLREEKSGSGDVALVAMIEGVLFEKDAFPKLRQVYLNGLVVSHTSDGGPLDLVPGGRLMRRLQQRKVKCEARLGRWCFFDHDHGATDWATWDGDSDDDDDDDGEVKWDTVLASV
ncbi:hypothetical protein QQZ08_001199 [Neonectria magnoliae]|uniref:F-box domain-containing protein n=1 Tax=Neonectria magnoliae TaxID=2732573 RepID=A0ABR1IG27_9HYPO